MKLEVGKRYNIKYKGRRKGQICEDNSVRFVGEFGDSYQFATDNWANDFHDFWKTKLIEAKPLT